MVERVPDKNEAEGPIPSARTKQEESKSFGLSRFARRTNLYSIWG